MKLVVIESYEIALKTYKENLVHMNIKSEPSKDLRDKYAILRNLRNLYVHKPELIKDLADYYKMLQTFIYLDSYNSFKKDKVESEPLELDQQIDDEQIRAEMIQWQKDLKKLPKHVLLS